jgi:hypothetical protein
MHTAKLADLEKRLSQIEQLVGASKLVSFVMTLKLTFQAVPTSSLTEAIAQLKEKLGVLTPPNVESVQRIVTTVAKDIDVILEKQKAFQTKTINEKKVRVLWIMLTI